MNNKYNKYYNKIRRKTEIVNLVSEMENFAPLAFPVGHPWAGSPNTLGSLCVMHLSILFIGFNDHDDPTLF